MDYAALPPEINSGRMYAGPGAGSMLAAAAAWDGLSAELQSAASAYESVIAGLTGGPWLGPSATAMAAAAAPYVAWMSATAGQAQLAAAQAQAAAGAYAEAFAATVPPPVIAANRAELATLVATNIFGQNTPAIFANWAHYFEMWAQDAMAMFGYATNSAAATAPVTPFTAAPETTNPAGLAAQGAAGGQAASTSIGTGVQSALSQLMSMLTTALGSLASPLSSASGGTSSGGGLITPYGVLSTNGFSLGGAATGLAAEYGYIPGLMGLSMFSSVLAPLVNPDTFLPFMQMNAAAAAAAQSAEAAAAQGAGSGFAGGFGGGVAGLGGLAGIGEAASVGRLSVPPSWGWAAGGPAGMLGTVPMFGPAAVPLAGNDVAAGLGFPVPYGGLGRAAAAGAGAGAGAAAVKYGSRLKFVPRSPAAGYSNESELPSTPLPPPAAKYPVPATFPTNGHAPPGYQAAIIYVPTNGHAPANK